MLNIINVSRETFVGDYILKQRIQEAFKKINIELSDLQVNQLLTYYEMLVEWNKVMNLTGITEFDDVLLKHFIDSVAICQITDINKINTVMDVGTGAGFPGMPLKIVFPHLKITLLDSLNKRIQFLNAVIEKLDLEDITTIHGRAEDYGRDTKYREQYDMCVSRAVANLSSLSEYCVPFIKVGGRFISYKAGEVEEEVKQAEKAVRTLHCEAACIEKIVLPDSDLSRSFVIIKKKGHLDKKYPRKAGMPTKNPL